MEETERLKNTQQAKRKDAYDSRCHGLAGGIALMGNLQTLVNAAYVTKASGPFFCRECLSEAIVRKCSDKSDHFAHKALLSPTAKAGNTSFHHGVRNELCAVLTRRFPEGCWKTEQRIGDATAGVVIPDISGYFGQRSKEFPAVAVEVQLSPYSPRYIKKKTEYYTAKNINVLWIVPLTRRLEAAMFRPRRYELYLHSMYLGYVFYYVPGSDGLLSPVHFGPAMRYIEPRTFYDENASEVYAGDYYLKYKTLKEPGFTEDVGIADLAAKSLKSWVNPNNSRLNLPQRKIMSLKGGKWWPADENKQWLKDNDWFAYVKKYLSVYNPDDEYDDIPGEDETEGVGLIRPA